MRNSDKLTLAIQKKGRLNRDSIDLLKACGVKLRLSDDDLLARAENMPLDLMLVRDDDIPTLVMEGVCDLGIVGDNVLREAHLERGNNQQDTAYHAVKQLGFGSCRLSIAAPQNSDIASADDLQGLRIATSYPQLTRRFLDERGLNASVFELQGSVEIAPRMGMADAICDLVSTGKTLEDHDLAEVAAVYHSQAVLIESAKDLTDSQRSLYELLLRRIDGALMARDSKYIMLHAPTASLETIKAMLPGSESPSVMPLEDDSTKVALHVVAQEGVFWDTLERLKQAGASSILVLPIEKIMN